MISSIPTDVSRITNCLKDNKDKIENSNRQSVTVYSDRKISVNS